MMSKISTVLSNDLKLPLRQDFGSLEEVRSVAGAFGHVAEATARARSSTEWVCDSSRAEDMQETLGLDDVQFLALLTALVERNRSIWGEYCVASLAPWYSHLIESVNASSGAGSREA